MTDGEALREQLLRRRLHRLYHQSLVQTVPSLLRRRLPLFIMLAVPPRVDYAYIRYIGRVL